MIRDRRSLIAALTLPLAVSLAACGGSEEAGPENDERSATGEILEGTISDAMLPVDQVRSQPPLLREEGDAADSGSGEADSPSDEIDGGEAAEEPSAPTDDTAAEPEAAAQAEAPPAED